MIMKLRNAKEGYVLTEDVALDSNHPIMFKDTILTKEKIEVLHAFLIENINAIQPSTSESQEDFLDDEESNFITSYLQTVEEYKCLFIKWQSGFPTHVTDIRKIFVPLLNHAFNKNEVTFFLHKYSTVEDYKYHHSISVGLYSGFLAQAMGLEKGEVIQVALAGCLSDVGMAKIPINILNKETKLTRAEYEEVKQHPLLGYKMLQKTSSLKKDAQLAILQHHERLDGSGYPVGSKADKIHLYSRIVAVADIYHAMTTDNKYQAGLSPYQVIEMIRYNQFGELDLQVIHALQKKVIQFGIESKVLLSNYLTGKIVFMNPIYQTRPLIIILDSNEMIDLDKRRDLFIEEVY